MRVAYLDFWPTFEPAHFAARFPALAALAPLEVVGDPRAAELVVFSCFPDGRRTTRPCDPRRLGATGVRLFYSAENVAPDFATCDFAMTFRRELVDARHLRVPNYVATAAQQGFAPAALHAPPADPAALLAAKTRFCAYVQGNCLPFREEFVRAVARYRRVDCAGRSLNNSGSTVDRAGKLALFRASKFAITFENEAAVGYVTEKLADALLAGCVPIYWGDPTVALDFDPRCFLHRRDFASADELVAEIARLDRDDAAYLARLAAPRAPAGGPPDGADPARLAAFFARVVAAVRARPSGRSPDAEPAPTPALAMP